MRQLIPTSSPETGKFISSKAMRRFVQNKCAVLRNALRGVGQSKQAGYHDRDQIKKTMRPEHARDDLQGAFAGDENETPQSGEKHSTNVKSRETEHSKQKTPKM